LSSCSVVVWKETCNKELRRERIKWVHSATYSGKKEVGIDCKPKVELKLGLRSNCLIYRVLLVLFFN
jgi:hypothetical protein